MQQIKLKKKYLSAQKGRYKGGANAAPLKNRKKIGKTGHEKLYGVTPDPKVMVVNGKTGHAVIKEAS